MTLPIASMKLTVLLLLTLCLAGCDELARGKQLRTYAELQVISIQIERIREEKGHLTPEDLVSTAEAYNPTDAWGRPWLIVSTPAEGGPISHWAMASAGCDGELEYPEGEYLTIEPRPIHDCPACDVVFRDGRAVRNAGK